MSTIEKIADHFSERIRAVRSLTGLSQTKFGEKVGIGQQHVYFLEAGRRAPSMTLVIAIASIYDEDVDWLIKGK